MVTLEITIDTQTFATDDFDALSDQGILLNVTGLVNRRWEEYSAVAAAACFGLQNVAWEQTWDDTPGSLTCKIGFPFHKRTQIETRFFSMDGIDHYEFYSLNWPFSDGY